jgi:hypothetical protein
MKRLTPSFPLGAGPLPTALHRSPQDGAGQAVVPQGEAGLPLPDGSVGLLNHLAAGAGGQRTLLRRRHPARGQLGSEDCPAHYHKKRPH